MVAPAIPSIIVTAAEATTSLANCFRTMGCSFQVSPSWHGNIRAFPTLRQGQLQALSSTSFEELLSNA